MASTSVVLLEEARANRAQAERARRLVGTSLLPTDVDEMLTRYAEELEERARELEQRALDTERSAQALAKTVGKTRQLAADLRQVVEETKASVGRSRAKRTPRAGSEAALRPYYVIRRDGSPMWLTRETPVTWGERAQAMRYRSKGEAARAMAQLRLGAVTIELL